MNKKNIAIFDFDGTIYLGESSINILFKLFPLKAKLFSIFFFPLGILYIFNAEGKIRHLIRLIYIFVFFRKVKLINITQKTLKFANQLNRKINPYLKDKIDYHQNSNHECWLISRSIDFHLKLWAQNNGFSKVIATRLESKNGIFNGNIIKDTLFKFGKKSSIIESLNNRDDYILHYYGDSLTDDFEMIQEADYGYLINKNSGKIVQQFRKGITNETW